MQLAILLIALLVSAPQIALSPEHYYPIQQEKLDVTPFVGTWVGHTDSGEFKLVLEKRKDYLFPNGQTYDIIIGRHAYMSKGATKNESLSKPAGKFAISAMPDSDYPGKLSGIFHDEVNHKRVLILLSFANSDKTKLSWVITRETETVNTDPAIKVLPGVSVPSNLVLEKFKQ